MHTPRDITPLKDNMIRMMRLHFLVFVLCQQALAVVAFQSPVLPRRRDTPIPRSRVLLSTPRGPTVITTTTTTFDFSLHQQAHQEEEVVKEPSSSASDSVTLLKELRSKTVRELKQELDALGISSRNALEKEDLVQELYAAQQQQSTKSKNNGNEYNTSSSSKQATTTTTGSSPPATRGVLTTPLLMSSIEHDIPVTAGNMPGGEKEWTLSPAEQAYCTIQVQVYDNKNKNKPFTLSLLLDTACSGIILRPEVAQRHNLQVRTSPVTLTSAGGISSSNSQMVMLDSFGLEEPSVSVDGNTFRRRFGPLPAALQDIGVLPQALDGIIGLSFLSQFDSVEFDFVNSVVSFYENEPPPPPPPSDYTLIGQGDLYMLGSLGIYALDTWWADAKRGPVRMLVDTGAATSYWSWDGVTQDLKIPRDSPTIQKLPGTMGIMGSDNMANPLTHCIYVSSRVGLKEGAGLVLSDRRLSVSIGEIPILQQLRSVGVGGILGLDVLRRCSLVRFRCKGIRPYLALYEKERGAE